MIDAGFDRRLSRAEDEISLEALGSIILRWRRTIIAFGLSGAVCGVAIGLLSRRVYETATTFIPQASDVGVSGLALAASRLGLNVPTNTSAWGPPVYVELLHSAALLGPLVVDTVAVPEEGGRRAVLMDLLEVPDLPPARRAERAVTKLRKVVGAVEDKRLGAVRLTVTTRWPSLSLLLAQRLVDGVTRFNLETRKSQAGADRQFVEGQAAEAERALREAEDRLQSFLQRNRSVSGSPELTFAQDRLQRDVAFRQTVYTSLMQSREEARIREVRDTPVITMLESPRLVATSKPRGMVLKGVLGGFLAGMLGVLIAFLGDGFAGARRATSEESREFFGLLHEATPRFLRRSSRA